MAMRKVIRTLFQEEDDEEMVSNFTSAFFFPFIFNF